ncbi:MAG TPA: hypothetical protein PLW50_00050 [Smithellaceae bacterium]|nr:hypothetical protein [Smithellaceae bacterium]
MKANAFIAAIFVLFMCTMPVASAASQFYTNKYVDYNPALLVQEPSSYGYVIFYIRAGGSAQDTTIWYYSLDTQKGIQEFDPSFLPDRSGISGQNPGYKFIKTLPIGETNLMKLPTGQYRAFLQNGNANQMEVQDFIIGGGDTTRVTFLGAGVSNPDICTTKPAHDEYRFRELIPAGIHIECFDEVNHTVTITDKEPWDENIYHPEVNHTVHVEEVNHTETIKDTQPWDEYHPEQNRTITVVDKPAIPGWTEYVYHPEVNRTEFQTPTCTVTSTDYDGNYRFRGDYYEYELGIYSDYVVQSAVWNYCGDYKKVGNHYEKTSTCGVNRYDVTFELANANNNVGHTDHTECVDNAYVDGSCGQVVLGGGMLRCVHDDPVCDPACVCKERVVVRKEAYTETIVHPEIPAETHEEIMVDHEAWTEHHPAGTHEEIVVDTPAHDEIVVDQEAYTETIHHPAGEHTEIVVDEPAHCDEITTGEQHWTEWSAWSTMHYIPIQGLREVEQKTIPKSTTCACFCCEKGKPQSILV